MKINKKNQQRFNKIDKFAKPLANLTIRNQNSTRINKRIYHLLCQPFTFVNAYSKISKNTGALTKSFSDNNIMSYVEKINADQIAQRFKNKTYNWSPVCRTWIPKPEKNKLRPIDALTQ